ncbi:hypothetical protein BZG02_12105 [Labilibaculum filiforme]|uniref:Uncharacterized protein n=1 Tax=Labilibaculum filiforme TaxID=1940526 RepID=A0A2N3HWM3_9BACT|nr:hypothetical protein [Labilibaculum filiforme]PKQ62465.1 hypothetical protein BZG02_12105 [Labilibaculum filiforme]
MLQFLIWISLLLPAQNNIEINQLHDFISADQFGNLYVVNKSELTTFNSNGEKLAVFSNSMLGSICHIDVSNPLRILVFYKDFNQLLFLDRNLAEIGGAVDLFEFSDNETELVCTAANGGFWIYNSTNNQAVHISDHGEIVNKSILLNSFFPNNEPIEILEYNNDLYLLYPEMGILILDRNGQFKKKNLLSGIKNFQFSKNRLLYTTEAGMYSFQALAQKDQLIYDLKGSQIIIRNNKLYLSNKKSISIKTLTL